MSTLLHIHEYDQFERVKDFAPSSITPELLETVRSLDEKSELEPAFLTALADPNLTPHGPAEIVDILTHRLEVNGRNGLAALILKGKSFPTVRPKDISHQIYRLRKIDGLCYAILAVSGNLLDQAKEEFISTAASIGCDYSIFDANDLARLLLVVGAVCPRDGRRIVAGRCQCGYRPSIRELNILQREALRGLEDARQLGQSAGLIVMPTGAGKTLVAAKDVEASGAKNVLYVAHTHEILDVAEADFASVVGSENVLRVEGAEDVHSRARVKLATIQLLSRQVSKLAALDADYIVVDEFHHAAAPTYRKLIEHTRPQFLLGLTATPYRADRRNVLELCSGNIIVDFELRMAIESGILVPYHYYGCFDSIDYSQLSWAGNRYSVRDLERALIIPERDHAIVKKWRELADGKPTLAFCCSKKHAVRMAEAFMGLGVEAACYLDQTRLEERRALAQQLQVGETKVLCVVDVLNEGADLPFVECLLFLRPTESKRIFFQQLGRGLRRSPGKFLVTVVDSIGNFRNAYRVVEYHGLLPDEYEERPPVGQMRNAKEVLNLPLGCLKCSPLSRQNFGQFKL